ncbi:MAG: T9SS type A sorting domain-containing protein [Bacteroidales bacterium]|jgi:hypothetical protein|nr:T9SS type A sorting domain-containing protein [Bacteroidales bacterium]
MEKMIVYILKSLLFILISISLNAQTYWVNEGSTVINQGTVLILNNIRNNDNGKYYLNGTITISGNFSNLSRQDVFIGDGLIEFNGIEEQNIYSVSPVKFSNVLVNSNAIYADTSLKLTGNIDLSKGIISMKDDSEFIFDALATWTHGSDRSFIDGNISKIFGSANNDFIFPAGDKDKFARISLNNVKNTDTETAFTVRYYKNAHENWNNFDRDNISTISQMEYWSVNNRSGSYSGLSVSLYWDDGNYSGIGDVSNLAIARYNGSEWVKLEESVIINGDEERGDISNTGVINELGYFTFASTNKIDTPLPIELLSFFVEPLSGSVNIEWITASELNNDRFDIERSENAVDFKNIATISGAGNSNTEIRYNYTDNDVNKNTVYYYRLKQSDYDGNFTYSPIRNVIITESDNFSVYPNPATGGWIELSTYLNDFEIQIINNQGQILISEKNNKYINISNINSGVYIIRLLAGDIISTEKLIINW